ncbi:hypothetical protein ISS30_00720 [bacterium]|nr:hypothetical protein [FCB group bacterium]MBL7190194.1 hypothetical protein [bacterium]
MKTLFYLIISLLTIFHPVKSQEIDLLEKALSQTGMSRSDLGYHPKGYWTRFPRPIEIPHIMPFFQDLFAEPLKTYDFTYSMAHAVNHYLPFDSVRAKSDALYQLSYYLGVEKITSGFRNYSVNLTLKSECPPFIETVARIYEYCGDELEYKSFGNTAGWPNINIRLTEQISDVPEAVLSNASWILTNLVEARRWRDTAFRNCDLSDMMNAFNIRDLGETQTDGLKYYPSIDDIAADIDDQSLYYACMKTIDTAHKAALALDSLKHEIKWNGFLRIPTPMGEIVITGVGKDIVKIDEALLVLDLGGDDRYEGPIGGCASLSNPISIAIDLDGDDSYICEDAKPCQGSGLFGAGVLIDWNGNDVYKAENMAQGCGFFGMGMLFDLAGDDDYQSKLSSQGCGYFGVGLLLESSGKDEYYLYGEGQGFGGVGGIGIIADADGDDKYTGEPYSKVVNRGDYHSENIVNVCNVQGVGSGRRGDGGDGHSWAGGLGVLIDLKGDDEYLSGNWSLGTGYWFGTGLVFDGAGDDLYKSVYFTQASGAHYCIGAMIDQSGDDRHELFENAGACLSFGWDYAVTLLIDHQGDDYYQAKGGGLALETIRSQSFLFELGGNDTYILDAGAEGMGQSAHRLGYDKILPLAPFYYYSGSIGLLIDSGGDDNYLERDKDGKLKAREKCGNNTMWQNPDPTDENYGHRGFGIGLDADSGIIPEIENYPKVQIK